MVGAAGYLAGGRRPVDRRARADRLRPVPHYDDVESRVSATALARAIAIDVGLAALAVLGLWDARSVAETHRETVALNGAQPIAVTVLVLVLAPS